MLKGYVRENDSAERFTRGADAYKQKSIDLAFVDSLFFPLILFLVGLSSIITIYVGGIEVMNGNITVGVIAEFLIYVNMLTWPVTALGWITSLTQRAAASQARINEFLHTQTDIVSQADLKKPIEGHVVFEQADFIYPDTGIPRCGR